MSEQAGGWTFTAHACRACLGRVIQRDSAFICSICGDEAHGSAAGICGCGIRIVSTTGQPAGFRCQINPARSPANPAEIVIQFGGEAGEPA